MTSVDRGHLKWLIKLEGKHRLRGHFDGATFCQNLGQHSGPCSRASPDCRALSAAGNGTDDRAQRRATASVLGSSLVDAHSGFAFLCDIRGADRILLPIDIQRLQIEPEVGSSTKPPPL